jgi:hypothetical protein
MAEMDQTGYPSIDPTARPRPPAPLRNGNVDEQAVREWIARSVSGNGGTERNRRQGARHGVH